MIEPRKPARGMDVLAWCLSAWECLRANRLTAGPGIRLKRSPSGVTISADAARGSSSSATPDCPFGELYTEDSVTKIRGGYIACGDKNFHVAGHPLNLATSGDWLIQIKLTGIDPATDDDDEIFLPGILTATGTPAWETKTNTEGSTNYDDHTNPSTPAATATAIIPIGRLVIADGTASLAPVACGNVTVSQCAGILSVSRP